VAPRHIMWPVILPAGNVQMRCQVEPAQTLDEKELALRIHFETYKYLPWYEASSACIRCDGLTGIH